MFDLVIEFYNAVEPFAFPEYPVPVFAHGIYFGHITGFAERAQKMV